jgi:hypothetical protein
MYLPSHCDQPRPDLEYQSAAKTVDIRKDKNMRLALLPLVIFGLLFSVARAEVIVPNNSTWKWLHPTDGKDPAKDDEDFHKTFYTADFDDSKWKEGKDQPGPQGGFGYGAVTKGGEELEFKGVDIGEPEEQNRKTAYFRLKFKTSKPFEMLKLKCQRDDGLIVYLDGKEVGRNNMPPKGEGYDLFTNDDQVVGGDAEVEVVSIPFKAKLEPGEHILAISLHNRANGSTDLRIAEISLETATQQELEAAKEDDDLF